MASLIALRLEMRSIVLKGVEKFRAIEFEQQLHDELLLDARQTYAAACSEPNGSWWAPSVEEIREACAVIQGSWSDEVRELRIKGGTKLSDEELRSIRLEKKRAYRAANRGAINVRRRLTRPSRAKRHADAATACC